MHSKKPKAKSVDFFLSILLQCMFREELNESVENEEMSTEKLKPMKTKQKTLAKKDDFDDDDNNNNKKKKKKKKNDKDNDPTSASLVVFKSKKRKEKTNTPHTK
jgi:hypothetical protein